MKTKYALIIVTTLFALFLAGCNSSKIAQAQSSPASNVAATPTPDIAATTNAAVAATITAQSAMQTTVNAAIAQTATAMPVNIIIVTGTPQPPQVVVITQQIPPTPAPTSTTAYYNLTEEQLAQLIEDSVEAALVASAQASAATTQATSDNSVSQEETVNVTVTVEGAEQLIAEVEKMTAVYTELYGDYATQTIQTLDQIEQDLSEISASLETTTQIMQQGAESASAAIDQLNAAAQQASENADEAKDKAQDWSQDVKQELDQLQQQMTNVQPNQIASNREDSIDMAHDYLDTIKLSMNDQKVSPAELMDIAQKGANASAGLQAHGGTQLSDFSNQVTNLTGRASRGQLPQLRQDADGFEKSFPERTKRDQQPGKQQPDRPQPGKPGSRNK